jgi:hypothetical protein
MDAAAASGTGPRPGAGDAVERHAGHFLGKHFAELDQYVGLGFEAIFVEIVIALAAAAQREFTMEQGHFGNSFGELFACHEREGMKAAALLQGSCIRSASGGRNFAVMVRSGQYEGRPQAV